MSNLLKYGILVFIVIIISFILLKPVLMHESEYRVIIVNTSEHPVTSVIISGTGIHSNKIGPIRVGNMQDYYFVPTQDGQLKYSITQNNQEFSGIINGNLKRQETGEKYIVIGEMFKVKIFDKYDAAY